MVGVGPLPAGFSRRATRLIGAAIETQYIGTAEQLSGTIDVGA